MVAVAKRDGGWSSSYCGHALAHRDSDEGWDLHGDGTRGLLEGYRAPELDHVKPRADGGSDRLDNPVLSCGPCNLRKGAKGGGAWQ